MIHDNKYSSLKMIQADKDIVLEIDDQDIEIFIHYIGDEILTITLPKCEILEDKTKYQPHKQFYKVSLKSIKSFYVVSSYGTEIVTGINQERCKKMLIHMPNIYCITFIMFFTDPSVWNYQSFLYSNFEIEDLK